MIYEIKGLMGFKKLKVFQIIYQRTTVEVTVAQKLNQGTIPKKGCNPCLPADRFFGWLFFDYFFGQAKKKRKNLTTFPPLP
jgi:hypothetical protein